MIPLFDLNGRVAIVTGGNGGIGLGMARGLAMAGATVVVAARNKEKNAAAVRDLHSHRTTAIALEVDVTQPESCHAMVAETLKQFGSLDILINNAGINIRKPPQDYSLEEWRRVLDTNLTSAFVCCQAAYPAMCRSAGGKIINIGSMTSLFGAGFAGPYGASKGGIVQLTKALASAWAKDNIQVNAVLPGWIDTELTQKAREQVAGLHQKILDRTPAARWGVPGDLEGIAVFLASQASNFITGTAIPVDGGYSAQA
jgi:2-dehydro-3-deoxy-D-gluconate 5-dehydrogenase